MLGCPACAYSCLVVFLLLCLCVWLLGGVSGYFPACVSDCLVGSLSVSLPRCLTAWFVCLCALQLGWLVASLLVCLTASVHTAAGLACLCVLLPPLLACLIVWLACLGLFGLLLPHSCQCACVSCLCVCLLPLLENAWQSCLGLWLILCLCFCLLGLSD